MIWYAIIIHLMWGILLVTVPLVGKDASGGLSWNIYVELGGQMPWGIAMIVGAVLAIASLFIRRRKMLALLLLLPQQFILTIGAIGIITSMLGVFDGFAMSRILRVLPLSWGAFICHTLAILDIHVWRK